MLRSYLNVALRTLRKYKTHTAINVVGLAVGLAVCLLIALFVRHELSYDRFHANADRIYQVLTVRTYDGGMENRSASMPIPLSDALSGAFPQVERIVRLKEGSGIVRDANALFEEEVLYADSAFFQMFTFPLVHGNPTKALDAPNNIVLATEKAKKYFGTTNVIGRRLSIRLRGTFYDFIVSGVAEPAPSTSSIQFGFIVPLSKLMQIAPPPKNPDLPQTHAIAHIQLRQADQTRGLEAQFPDFVQSHVPDEEAGSTSFELLPLTDIHLTPGVYGQLEPPSRPRYAYVLIGMAALILLIASINFVTLAIGRSTHRAREVGVRKTMGAARRQVMAQFWGEALLLCAGALVLGVGLARLALPVFNRLVDEKLAAGALLEPGMLLVFVGLLVVVGLAAGSYPAAILSGFRPVAVLRGWQDGGRAPRLMQGLVVVQFVLAIGLVAGTLVMWRQMDLLRTKDLGFQKEHVVQIDGVSDAENSRALLERYRRVAASASSVQQVTGTWKGIAVGNAIPNRFATRSGDREVQAHAWRTHFGVVETLGLRLIEGRSFSPEHGADAAGETVLVNEALVGALGWDEPIGKTLSVQHRMMNLVDEAEVVGVVENFHFQSLRRELEPIVLHMRPIASTSTLYARVAPGQTADALDRLGAGWAKTVPELPFSFTFLNEAVEQQYQSDARWAQIVTYAAGFALFIACLGLFGLATLAVRRRTKEIGVRKVLGASAAHIVTLLSKDFARLVLVAFILAAPLAYWVTQRWLEAFAYRVEPGPWIFLGAGVLALAVAMASVGMQTLRVARLDPAITLRDE